MNEDISEKDDLAEIVISFADTDCKQLASA